MEQHISVQRGDARDEQMKHISTSPARPGPTAQVPSANLALVTRSLAGGALAELKGLATRIDEGEATKEDDEAVYDGFVLLVQHVEDLAAMCQRREAALAECGVAIGR